MSNTKKSPLPHLDFSIYGTSVAIFTLYFNWQYAQRQGFIPWLLFGEFQGQKNSGKCGET